VHLSARHGAVAGRRPVSLIVVVATVVGIWFGLHAPGRRFVVLRRS
jgi:hypothetical protein